VILVPKKQTLKEQGWYKKSVHQKWRRLVMQRDNWLCQECLRHGRITPATEAHHKIPLEERPDLGLNVDNGEALCWDCHEVTKVREKKKLPGNVRIIKA
jgi:5-methylcytosine-specific restriction endonuclease McrA